MLSGQMVQTVSPALCWATRLCSYTALWMRGRKSQHVQTVIITFYPGFILYHCRLGSASSLCLRHFMIKPLSPGWTLLPWRLRETSLMTFPGILGRNCTDLRPALIAQVVLVTTGDGVKQAELEAAPTLRTMMWDISLQQRFPPCCLSYYLFSLFSSYCGCILPSAEQPAGK